MRISRADIILAAMVPAPRVVWFDPIRIQKLLFLIDKEVPSLVHGPHFNFQPYSYGPVDLAVYLELEALTADSCVHTDRTLRYLRFRLTSKGIVRGEALLSSLPDKASRFVKRACEWIWGVSLHDLLSAIYRRYPEMAVNAVALQLIPRSTRRKRQSASTAFLTGLARTMDFMGLLDERPAGTDGYVSDAEAIGADWRRVGDHLRAAMGQMDSVRGRK